MKIKEEKRIEREKKKEAVSTDDYIRKALKKGSSRPNYSSKGNHGNKQKNKQTALEIKETFF